MINLKIIVVLKSSNNFHPLYFISSILSFFSIFSLYWLFNCSLWKALRVKWYQIDSLQRQYWSIWWMRGREIASLFEALKSLAFQISFPPSCIFSFLHSFKAAVLIRSILLNSNDEKYFNKEGNSAYKIGNWERFT